MTKQAKSSWYARNKQVVLYLLFGSVTTVCALLACYLTLKLGVRIWHDEQGNPTAVVDILGSTSQWIVGLLLAFFTNKRWVFTKAEHGVSVGFKQFGVFASSRVITYFLEVALNLVLIALLEGLHYHAPSFPLFGQKVAISARFWAKLISSATIVVINYFISKLIVFRKKKDGKEKNASAE